MENSGDDLEQSNEEQPSNFLVLASQSETQYSEWDQQHLLQSLPALKTQPPPNPKEKQRSQELMLGKSDDERQGVKGSVLVEETTEYEVSPYEHDDKDRIEDSCSEDESDSPGDVTVVKKMATSNDDVSDSPVYKSQDGQTSVRDSMRDLRSVRNLFPATLSQEDASNRQEEDKEDRIVATPSEHIGSLHLSGQAVTVPETVEESLDVLAPSPEAYGDIPVIIPSSPTASDDEADKSTFNPDANRTLESEDLSTKGHQKRDKRERLRPAVTSIEDKPILIEDTVPEEMDEPVVLDPNIKTLACEETQGDSLHLVYSATEAGNSRLPSEEKEMEHRDENSQKGGQQDVIEDSQDLALHLSQSQGESIHPPGTSSKRPRGVPLSQSAADQAKRTSQSKSSSDSNGFHLSVPKDGGLIHPRKDTTTSDDQKHASQQEQRPVVPSVPSLSIAQMESQSQTTSETSFRIEKPELHMTEEGEEAAREMNVFQKTRVGRQRPVHKQLNLSEDSSEDYFNIEGSRGKEKRVSVSNTDAGLEDNQAKAKDAVPVVEDAETQEHQASQMKADAEKVKEQSEVHHPFDENTETYEVPKSLERDVVEETGQGDTNIACAADKVKEPIKQNQDEDVRESVEPGYDPKRSEFAVTKPQVTDVSSVIPDPIPSTSRGITRKQTLKRSPRGRGKSVVDPSEDVTSSKGKTRGYSEREQNPKKTVPERVDSTSSTRGGKTSRSRNISLPKDSGIGEQLDLTSRSETSPRQGQPPLERIPSDPYVFHGSQSQQQEKNTAKKSLPTTPVSSRKKQKVMLKRASTKKDSSSSDIKEPVAKPRPKKLKFTKLQRSSSRKSTTNVVSSTAPNSSEAVLGPSVGKQGSVSAPSSPGTGFEADISRSISSQTTLQKHVAFQKPETTTPPLPPQEIVRTPLSDSQLSDQLVETVTVTVEKKTVQRTKTVTTVVNADGRIVKTQKQEEYEETPYTTVMFSEKKTELPLVSPSRTASSLTPGDLADISSGYSRSASSGKGSLEKSSSSLSLVSPSVQRKDESFTTLLTSSSIQLSQTHGITSHITSPQVHTQNTLLASHRVTKTPVSDIANEGRATTPDESVIEKSDSRIGAVVSSSGERRASESLFTSPDNKKGRKKTSSSDGQAEEQMDSATNKQSSPALRKRAADSSQDSLSDIPSAQRPRMSESGGFSVHGSAYSQQRPRLDAPLSLLVTTDSDIPPSQNRRTTRAEKRKSTEKSSSDDAHMSPEIPLQTTSNTEVSEATDQQCPVVHASKPEIGSKVMAKWKDGFFYPGKILKLEQSGRFYIKFDDGDQMNVKVQHILLVNHIPIGQSVMVMSADGYFDCGMVVGYVGEGENIMYKVSRDEGSTRRYSRSQIILSEDQASCLMSDEEMRVPAALTAGTSSTKLGDVSLDNLVVGERRSRHRTVEEKPDKMKENEESPMKTQESGRVTRKGRSASRSDQKKDKAKETSSRGKKRKVKEGPMATSTPTPKAKRPAESTVSVTPMTPSTSTMGGAVDSPSESRRHGRKARVGLFEKDKPQAPRSKSPRMFSGMVFLLTHVEKSEEQKQQEKKLLQDSSLETSTEESGIEDEPTVPFDKESLRANIEAAGGVVLDKFNQAQIDAATKAFLISSSFQRTVKYLQCLAAGVPCVSHQWVIYSCSEGKLLDHKAYMLPAGISLERRKLMEWNPCGSCLGGKVVMVLSPNIQFQDAWQSILTISRCKLVNRLPVRGKADAMVDVIIADTTEGSCPLSTQHQAKKLNVPIVTTEWVIQCLINGHTVGYDAHPEYKHNLIK